jgi:dTDP-4-dehydrorhamnose reductase
MILVFGKTGQVARELARREPGARFLSRAEADLANPVSCATAIRDLRPGAVINAAAYTAVDRAEDDEALATTVNGAAPGAMAAACAKLGIPIVQISTDYVFDGSGEKPFATDAPPNPLGAYGRSKLAGEEAVRASGAAHAILRTSWVFSSHGGNFVKTMLRLADTRDRLSVVADQTGGPTPAGAIAHACLVIASALRMDSGRSGTYHFAGAPDVSWAGFAREIFRQAEKPVTVEDIPSSAYPTPAIRPLNSRLDCTSLSVFGLSRPDWHGGLAETLAELETV